MKNLLHIGGAPGFTHNEFELELELHLGVDTPRPIVPDAHP
jgi:hypothetical protein